MLYIPEQHRDRPPSERDTSASGPIPRLFFHPRDLVYRTPQKRGDRYTDAFVYEPENIDERQLGTMCIVGEISNVESGPTLHIINLIASTCKKEYYRLPRRGAKRSFEAALQKVNAALTDFTIQGFTDWLGNLDVLILTFDGHHLHVSRLGDARALLVRDSNILEITQTLQAPSQRSKSDAAVLKSFSNVVHGALAPDDVLVLGSKTLFRHMSIENIRRLASDRTPKSFLHEVSRLFSSSDEEQSPMFSVITAQVTETEQTLDEPEISQNNSPVSVASLMDSEDLPLGEEITKERREPLPLPAQRRVRAPLQRPRNWKQAIVYWIRRFYRAFSDGCWHLWQFLKNYVFPAIAKAVRWIGRQLRSLWKRVSVMVAERRAASPQSPSTNLSDVASSSTEHSSGRIKMSIQRALRSVFRTFSNIPRRLQSSPIVTRIVLVVAILLIIVLVASLLLRRHSKEKEVVGQQLLEQRASVEDQLQQLEVHIIYKQYDRARELLAQLQQQVDALALADPSADVATYRSDLLDAADKIDQIIRIDSPASVLADLGGTLQQGLPVELMGSGTTLYTYSEDGTVASVSLDTGAVNILGTLPAKPLHGDIIPTRESLVFYTEDGLMAMNTETGEVTAFPIEGFLQGDVRDLATYATSLYYFDLENNQVLRHTQTPSSMTDGIAWIKLADRTDLTNVRSLSINGSLYMLFSDGRIVRYLSGYQKETLTPSLSTPITDASKIFVTQESGQIFVVEPSKQRLIILDSKGVVQAQYTGAAFSDIHDVWVQEETQKIFVLSGTQVFEVQ